MAITATERQAIVRALMLSFGEDTGAMGRLIHFLRLEAPAVDWPAVLTTLANNWQPFRDSGLSTTWWVNEVLRIADTIQS
jgi:hypothetical protein